jgi:hypothetical protein
MREIKIVISKGGKLKMLDKDGTSAQFTEKLAKELGQTEERHKGGNYTQNEQNTEIQQGH